MSMTQDQRDRRAERRKAEDAKGFDINVLDIRDPYLLGLRAKGELHGVFINGKRCGWYCVFIGSLADAKKHFESHCQNQRQARLVSQTGTVSDSEFEMEAL